MFCYKCGKEIKQGSIFSGNCGAPVSDPSASEPVSAPHETANAEPSSIPVEQENPISAGETQTANEVGSTAVANTSKNIRSFMVIVFICAVAFILFKGCGAILGSGGAAEESSAKLAARKIVEEQLKAPSTAEFSNVEIEDKDNYGRYLITMTVDAQNGFGAMMRSQHAVVVRIDGDNYYYSTVWATSSYEAGEKEATLKLLKSMNDWGEEPSSD